MCFCQNEEFPEGLIGPSRFNFCYFEKLTPRKSFLNSQRIIPENQVFESVNLKLKIIHFLAKNIQILKSPDAILFVIPKTAVKSQRIVFKFPENHFRILKQFEISVLSQNIQFLVENIQKISRKFILKLDHNSQKIIPESQVQK